MISCKRATELMSKSRDEGLTRKEELALQLHLFICEFCELFRKQLALLQKAVRHDDCECERKLPSEAKVKILEQIGREKD